MNKFAPVAHVALTLCAVTIGCSGTDSTGPSVGGASTTAIGGSNSTGGFSSAGGGLGTGGNAAPGGGSPSGGAAATGGVASTGGATSNIATGGVVGTGGSKAGGTGGLAPTGGSKAVGGSAPTGGSNATGGSPVSTGGSKATGGNMATGGTPATGGSKATGGTPATGGSKATGGTPATGGTTTAGGAATFKCANLSFKSGTTGKVKPTGAVGGMRVLNWAGFSSAISYTFDDANSSQINNYAAMKSAGGHYTFYLITSKTEASSATYKTALSDGNEIGNHTSDHSNCTSASVVDTAQTFIKNTFGVTAYAFAAPNGSTLCNVASVSDKFLTNRSVSGGSTISPGDTSQYAWLPSDIPATTGASMTAVSGKWRVFCIHGFQGGTDGAYQAIPLSAFTSAVQTAVSGGSWVETVTNIAAYNWGQKAIGTNTTSATWTLPSVFPPNMCVRITTTGGTVTQKGQQVPWDDHGYYEISLDAGSVTIQ